MNNLCYKFKRDFFNKFKQMKFGIIIYGSNIFEEISSDLDLCIVGENITEQEKWEIKEMVIQFHNSNKLKLDDEVPYNNKLFFSYEEIINAIIYNPFIINGKINIRKIQKDKQFLSSIEMRKRLIINILTTKHIMINCDTSKMQIAKNMAWDLILKVIIEYSSIKTLEPDVILKNLYYDSKNDVEGEMFLGYKKGNMIKEEYLLKEIKQALIRNKL